MAHLTLSGTFADADTRLGRRDAIGIGHNTRAIRRGRDIAVRYYATDIVTLTPDGWSIVDIGQWSTVTTWSRVNALLPAPFGMHSNGMRGQYLFAHGAPILPYVDGLAVNGATGAVGMAGDPVGILYTAEDVTALRAAHDAERAARDAKRAERERREHPYARRVTYRADRAHADYQGLPPMPSPHRYHAWDCAACRAERDEWAAIRADTLRADHASGHAWSVTLPPLEAFGQTAQTVFGAPAGPCPWDCPERIDR
jgi:hypothetical protein